MRVIDLRSDTITQPSQPMREAMACAKVGDDVFGEDPTVRKLEVLAAECLGKEAGLFVASGTMGNLLALLSHTSPGDEVILEADSHIYNYEVGGVSRIAGLVPRLLSGVRGMFCAEELRQILRAPNIHYPPTTLVCLENTHNSSGGCVLPQDQVAVLSAYVHGMGMKMHLDGARVFNAAAASGVSVREIAKPFDSVMFCLSKGLAAPVGSLLVGEGAFVTRARRFRKLVGGGMRQAGVLAAAGIYALDVMAERLHEDHQRAATLATALHNLPGLSVTNPVETNIVNLSLDPSVITAETLLARWEQKGILALPRSATVIRLVTHCQITDADVAKVIMESQLLTRS